MASPPHLLMVEGRDDKHALCRLLQASPNDDVQAHLFSRGTAEESSSVAVKEHGGFEELRSAIPETIRKEADLQRAGIVVDYDFPEREDQQSNRWRSLQRLFQNHFGSNLPSEPPSEGWTGQVERPEGPIDVGVWLMPDNQAEGALEAFAKRLVSEEDVLLAYAEDCLEGLPVQRFAEKDRDKALIHTWLAWQEKPNMRIGEAVSANVLDPEQPLAERFVEWARRLFEG